MMSSLKGQTILFVGGSSGIGFGAAQAAHKEGARVIIASSKEATVQAAIARLGGVSIHVSGGVIDVNTEAGVQFFFANHGAVDHIVYTAGQLDLFNAVFPGLDVDKSRSLFDVRYWGVLNIAKIAPKYIRQSLTITGGTSAYRPFPGWSAIVPVVGALPSLVRTLSIDLAPQRVNVITPGWVNTELSEYTMPDGAECTAILAKQAEKQLVHHIADANEIAEAYLFAMKCRYFTGQELIVDGGAVLV